MASFPLFANFALLLAIVSTTTAATGSLLSEACAPYRAALAPIEYQLVSNYCAGYLSGSCPSTTSTLTTSITSTNTQTSVASVTVTISGVPVTTTTTVVTTLVASTTSTITAPTSITTTTTTSTETDTETDTETNTTTATVTSKVTTTSTTAYTSTGLQTKRKRQVSYASEVASVLQPLVQLLDSGCILNLLDPSLSQCQQPLNLISLACSCLVDPPTCTTALTTVTAIQTTTTISSVTSTASVSVTPTVSTTVTSTSSVTGTLYTTVTPTSTETDTATQTTTTTTTKTTTSTASTTVTSSYTAVVTYYPHGRPCVYNPSTNGGCPSNCVCDPHIGGGSTGVCDSQTYTSCNSNICNSDADCPDGQGCVAGDKFTSGCARDNRCTVVDGCQYSDATVQKRELFGFDFGLTGAMPRGPLKMSK